MVKGSKQTQEAKNKIRAAKLGKSFTSEHSQAISKALKGQKKTIAHKKAISDSVKITLSNKISLNSTRGETLNELL